MTADTLNMGAVEQAQAIREGRLSCAELMQATLARIAAVVIRGFSQ